MSKSTILERGKFFRKRSKSESLSYFPENKSLVAELFRMYRMEWVLGANGEILNEKDREWVCVGRIGQIWEYGIKTLGISVEGERRLPDFIEGSKDFAVMTQNGDAEANFKCAWTTENVSRLSKLLLLIKRRTDLSSFNMALAEGKDAFKSSGRVNTAESELESF